MILHLSNEMAHRLWALAVDDLKAGEKGIKCHISAGNYEWNLGYGVLRLPRLTPNPQYTVEIDEANVNSIITVLLSETCASTCYCHSAF